MSLIRYLLGRLGIMITPRYDDDEEPIYEDNNPESSDKDEIQDEQLDMRIGYLGYAPSTVWLELKGLAGFGEDDKRLGVDVVARVDVSSSSNMLDNESRKILQKRAMELFISKLRPIDRLSVVVFSERLCPLRFMSMEAAKEDIEVLVNAWLELGADIQGHITASLREALRVLDDRTHFDGRQPAIMLLSGNDATDDAIYVVSLGNIPVQVLALGANFTYDGLKQIGNKSSGGTFSVLNVEDKESISNLRNAFSQCFSQLFTVAVQDLKLSIALPIVKTEQEEMQDRVGANGQDILRFWPRHRTILTNLICNDEGKAEAKQVKIESITEIVDKGLFHQTWSGDDDRSASLSLGHLYCQDTRKLMVSLNLPWWSSSEDVFNEERYFDEKRHAKILQCMYSNRCRLHNIIDKEADAQGLKITYSYSDRVGQRNAVVGVRLET